MQEKNMARDATKTRRETRFFLAMAKTGPYIEREHHNLTVSPSNFRARGGNFSVVKRGASRAAGDVR
jgi:hypothetical protein